MRVAYICADPGIPVFGTKGASVHVQEIVRSFLKRGDEVRLYCTRTGKDVPADLASTVTVTERKLPSSSGPDRERAQRLAADELARLAVDDGCDLVYERYSLFSTAMAQVAERLSIPAVLEVNAPLIQEQAEHRELYDAEGAQAVLRTLLRWASRAVCVSVPVAGWLGGQVPDGARPRIAVEPNGVNTERITPGHHTADDDIPVVLFVGTLKPWHGVETLLDAAALAKTRWRLRIIGDGPLGARLREDAADRGLNVEFTGAVSPAQVPGMLLDCAVAAAPYPATQAAYGNYFSPLKIYEYAAAGLPIVASRIGQVPAIIRDGETGILVAPSDAGELAAGIDSLIGNPARGRKLGEAGRARAVDNYSWDGVLDRTLAGVFAAAGAPTS